MPLRLCLLFVPWCPKRKPIPVSIVSMWKGRRGGVDCPDPSALLCSAIGRHAKRHQFKTRCGTLPSLYTSQLFKKDLKGRVSAWVCVCVCVSLPEITSTRCLPTPPTWGWSSPFWPWFWSLLPSSCLLCLWCTMMGNTAATHTPLITPRRRNPWISTPVSPPEGAAGLKVTFAEFAGKEKRFFFRSTRGKNKEVSLTLA